MLSVTSQSLCVWVSVHFTSLLIHTHLWRPASKSQKDGGTFSRMHFAHKHHPKCTRLQIMKSPPQKKRSLPSTSRRRTMLRWCAPFLLQHFHSGLWEVWLWRLQKKHQQLYVCHRVSENLPHYSENSQTLPPSKGRGAMLWHFQGLFFQHYLHALWRVLLRRLPRKW